jgi:Iap family predicted aminopeptidase
MMIEKDDAKDPSSTNDLVIVFGTSEYIDDNFCGVYESLEEAKRAVTRSYSDYVVAYRLELGADDVGEALAWAWGSHEHDLDWKAGPKP